MRLTPLAKTFIAGIIGIVCLAIYFTPSAKNRLFPQANHPSSMVPMKPDFIGANHVPSIPGCADKPKTVIYIPAWNATMGLIRANGGKQSTADSILCSEYGLNVEIIREDDTSNAYGFMASFAESYQKGNKHPSKGGPIFIAMGDGGAMHATKVNKVLSKLGTDSHVIIPGAIGFSNGEDKVMVSEERRKNPELLRGSYLAVVPGDGDDLLLLEFLAMNNIPCNRNFKVWDSNAVNIAPAKDYNVAAQMFAANYCEDLENIVTHKTEKHCVDGVSTWTPGDVHAADKRGGVVSLISTREFPNQMPATLFVYAPWAEDNANTLAGILAGSFQAADLINENDAELRRGAAMSVEVYGGEQNAEYWYTYFKGVTRLDKTGTMVSLGGSRVSGYAEINNIFSGPVYRATYTSFGRILSQQMPDDLPTFDPIENVLTTRYLKMAGNILREKGILKSTTGIVFDKGAQIRHVIGHRSWDIRFATGKADLLPSSNKELDEILTEAGIANTAIINIDGHTDDRGSADVNLRLSTARANRIRDYLHDKSPELFPANRVRVRGHGMMAPLASNETEEGRAQNRRVEITFGLTD